MTEQTIQSVFVLGSGTMGAGIAEVAIKAGADAESSPMCTTTSSSAASRRSRAP